MAPIEDVPVADDEEGDSPAIKAMKALDQKYCELEVELEKEIEALELAFLHEKTNPMCAERASVLTDLSLPGAAAEKEYGTPACVNFWLQTFQNSEFAEMIEEYDAPVITYMKEIKRSFLDDKQPLKGFRLELFFVENPYFSNSSLWVEFVRNYDPDDYKPWKEPECIEMRSCDISWNPGKNVTVEVIAKQVKGGGAKKAKQKAKGGKEEPRDSFFRFFFRNLKVGDDIPADISMDGQGPDTMDEDDKKGIILMVLNEQFYRMADMIAEMVIPYAVRYYTGEADAGDADGMDSGSEDDEGNDDDDEDEGDDSEQDEPAPKVSAKKGGKKEDGSSVAAAVAKAGGKQEECKQQ